MDRFCDSSSLTSVETMPSPPLRNRKLSRRRSSQPCLNSNSSEDEEMDHDHSKHDNNSSDDFKCDSGFVEDQHSHPKSELQRRQKFIITAGEDLSSLGKPLQGVQESFAQKLNFDEISQNHPILIFAPKFNNLLEFLILKSIKYKT